MTVVDYSGVILRVIWFPLENSYITKLNWIHPCSEMNTFQAHLTFPPHNWLGDVGDHNVVSPGGYCGLRGEVGIKYIVIIYF